MLSTAKTKSPSDSNFQISSTMKHNQTLPDLQIKQQKWMYARLRFNGVFYFTYIFEMFVANHKI